MYSRGGNPSGASAQQSPTDALTLRQRDSLRQLDPEAVPNNPLLTPATPNNVPRGGYFTEIVTFPPDSKSGWTIYSYPKQPACRHNLKGNVTFVDGHVETWTYQNFRSNKFNIFAINNEL